MTTYVDPVLSAVCIATYLVKEINADRAILFFVCCTSSGNEKLTLHGPFGQLNNYSLFLYRSSFSRLFR
jgi:hypothetical protein